MERKEIIDEIKKIVSENLFIQIDNIKESSRLIENLNASSFDLMIMLPAIERKFDVEFSIDELKKISTIGDLADTVLEKV